MVGSKLSKLQRALLAEGLRAYFNEPIARAWGGAMAGSFRLGPVVRSFYGITKSANSLFRKSLARRQELAAPFAAASRAIRHLAARGLVEKRALARSWGLTRAGLKVARVLCPEVISPSREEQLPKIQEAYRFRKARLEAHGIQMPMSPKEFSAAAFNRKVPLEPTPRPVKPGSKTRPSVEEDGPGVEENFD